MIEVDADTMARQVGGDVAVEHEHASQRQRGECVEQMIGEIAAHQRRTAVALRG
jgi:hypothetical protein